MGVYYGRCPECGHATWRYRIKDRWRFRRRWFLAPKPLSTMPIPVSYSTDGLLEATIIHHLPYIEMRTFYPLRGYKKAVQANARAIQVEDSDN